MLFMWIPWCHQLPPQVSCSRQSSDLRWKNPRAQQNELSLNHFGQAEITLLHQQSINPHPQLWHPQGEKMLGSAEGWSRSVESLLLQCIHYTESKKFLFTQKFSLPREKNWPPSCRDLTEIPHRDNAAAKPWDAAEEQHWVALEDKFSQQ